jgi:superfamily II DNA or RNA helicase
MLELKDYQERVIGELGHLAGQKIRRLVLQLPTGAGKTVVCANIIGRFLKRTPNQRVVIFVHREELVKQMRIALFEWVGINAELIIPSNKSPQPAQVYICMVETANNRLKKQPSYFGKVGLTIVDESHRGEMRKIEEYFPTCIHIGLTATPLSSSKKDPLKNHYDEIVCGPSISELIDAGALCSNRTFHATGINRKSLRMKGDDYDQKQMGEEYSRQRHVKNCVKGYQDHANGTKAIVFNCTIEHSRLVEAAFIEAGYPCRHIDSEQTGADSELRRKTLQWFRDTPGAILCNVGLFGVGFDEPSIETIIFNLSTVSVVKWLQGNGRGSRPFPGKKFFTIIDMGGNALNLGDWSDDRDWHSIFHNPPKPREKLQPPPVKDCPKCQAIVHASVRVCKYCGFTFPVAKPDTDLEVRFEQLRKERPVKIDVDAMISANHGKEYAVLHQIKAKFISQAKYKWGVTKVTEQMAEALIAMYQSAAKDWCNLRERKFNRWHEDITREWMIEALEKTFGYAPPLAIPFTNNPTINGHTKPVDLALHQS